MSNILSDILGLDAKRQYKSDPLNAKDVFVIGDVHQPRMLGISSPIPIRDEKLVTFYDLALSVIGLLRIENVGSGVELVIPPSQTGNPFLWNVRTLVSTDNTVAITENPDNLDFSAVFSTDVHVNGFTYAPLTHVLEISLNSGSTFSVDISNLALEVLDDSVSVDTNVTQISFDGPGVTASLDGTGITVVEVSQGPIFIQEEGSTLPIAGSNGLQFINFIGDGVTASSSATNGTIDVTVADQEEVFLLMSSSCYFTPVRVGETYTITPPVNPVYRFGGANPGFATGDIFTADTNNWNDSAAQITVGSNPQTFVAKEDQITQAIPIPIDLAATDKIKISGTCYVNQDIADGQAKIKVALGQGECADDRAFNILNISSIDTFSGVAEDATNARRGAYQRMCFEFDTVIGGDGAQVGEDHFFIGFSFEGLNLPTTGDYTEAIAVTWNMSAIKNPS